MGQGQGKGGAGSGFKAGSRREGARGEGRHDIADDCELHASSQSQPAGTGLKAAGKGQGIGWRGGRHGSCEVAGTYYRLQTAVTKRTGAKAARR